MTQQFDRAEPGNCASHEESCEKSDAAIGSDSKNCEDGTDRAARNNREHHCASLLNAKMQTPHGNWAGWKADGSAGDESQKAIMQASQPDCVYQIGNSPNRGGCR